jgi:hypothetical protein
MRIAASTPPVFPPLAEHVISSGALLADHPFDLVRPDGTRDRLAFVVLRGDCFSVEQELNLDGVVYNPVPIDYALAAILPTGIGSFTSTAELFDDLRRLFAGTIAITEASASLVACFVLATWMSDRLPFVPPLVISGPPAEARHLLKILTRVCRRALPLAYLDASGFLSLPAIHPTLVVQDFDPSDRLLAYLRNSNANGDAVPHRGKIRDCFCAKVIYCGQECDPAIFGDAVHVVVDSMDEPIPWVSAEEGLLASRSWQNRLLGYRLKRWSTVEDPHVGRLRPLGGRLQRVAYVFAALLRETDINKSLPEWLTEQAAAECVRALVDLKAIAIEALLALCHEGRQEVQVGEVANIANVILYGRGEGLELSPRKVGAVLRGFGISGDRKGAGVAIRLSVDLRPRIHRLGLALGVASARVPNCAECSVDLGRET